MSEPGSMTTPQPITQRQPLCRIPEGIVCRTYFSRPTTTVWPALLPPWKRTTTFTWGVITSTTLPLPSSPHCAPITTMLGIPVTSQLTEGLHRIREHVRDRHLALTTLLEIEHHQLAGVRAPTADDEHVAHPLCARILDRLLQAATAAVARHPGPESAEPSRE